MVALVPRSGEKEGRVGKVKGRYRYRHGGRWQAIEGIGWEGVLPSPTTCPKTQPPSAATYIQKRRQDSGGRNVQPKPPISPCHRPILAGNGRYG